MCTLKNKIANISRLDSSAVNALYNDLFLIPLVVGSTHEDVKLCYFIALFSFFFLNLACYYVTLFILTLFSVVIHLNRLPKRVFPENWKILSNPRLTAEVLVVYLRQI